MLSRKYKLSRAAFPHHTDRRVSWVGGVLRVQAYPPVHNTSGKGEEGEKEVTPQFSVVVPKSLSDGAVTRNRFKRRVLGTIRQHLVLFERLPYKKYIITPKIHIRMNTVEQITNDVNAFLVKHQ